MNLIRVKNYEEMSKKAAAFVLKTIRQKPHAVLGLATGSTPKGLYQELAADHKQNGTSYREATSINLDEYIGLPAGDKNSYHTFMKEALFDHIDMNPSHIHLPNGEAENLEEECKRYEALIDDKGIDLQVLGIGQNGHIGFNEPGTPFQQTTHVTVLTESTRMANARFFDLAGQVPQKAITMGIASIMKSKEILLLASGPNKAEAIRQLLAGDVSEQFPASALHDHARVTLIADEEALSAVK